MDVVTLTLAKKYTDKKIIGGTTQQPTIDIDQTLTLPHGQEAKVENIGNKINANFKFSIPEGKPGPQGPTGAKGADGINGKDGKDYIPTVDTITTGVSKALVNNVIYRAANLSKFQFTLPTEQTMESIFNAEVDITVGSPMEVIAPTGIDWQGDNIVNNAWVPVENKRYTLFFYWDGIRYRGISQSQKLEV